MFEAREAYDRGQEGGGKGGGIIFITAVAFRLLLLLLLLLLLYPSEREAPLLVFKRRGEKVRGESTVGPGRSSRFLSFDA